MLRSVINRVKNFTTTAFSDKFLLATNVGISVSLSGVGDMIEQQYEIMKKEIDKWDKRRTLNMSVSGMTVGVFCHHWYLFLDHHFPGRSFKLVCKKVLMDQMLASPIVILLFFTTLGVLKKSTKGEVLREMKDKAMTLYLAEWIVWPTAQIINFTILPTRYRVLYDNTISLGYDVYTSAIINAPCKDELNSNNSDKVQISNTGFESQHVVHCSNLDKNSKLTSVTS
uniref:CSON006181 protein n=1 Tax=Culicoides sonorensis TaxID=179676 RepID=A0A336LZI3_CULSO